MEEILRFIQETDKNTPMEEEDDPQQEENSSQSNENTSQSAENVPQQEEGEIQTTTADSTKRNHSDQSENEDHQPRRRRRTSNEDPILEDTALVFAKMSQKLEDIRVYQSDVDTVRANESELNINIPGYRGDKPQIIRLITLYK